VRGSGVIAILKSPIVVLIVYLGSVYFLVLIGADDYRAELRKDLGRPNTTMWCVLTASQMTVWVFLIGPAYRRALKYRTQFREQRYPLLGDLSTIVALSVIFVSSRYRSIQPILVPGESEKMVLVTVFGALTLLPSLVGFRLASSEARVIVAERADVDVLRRLDELRADLRWFLIVASSIVATIAVTRGVMHNAIVAINQANAAMNQTKAPDTGGVILFAAYFSLALAMFYVPAHMSFVAAARSAVKQLTSGKPKDAEEWVTVMDQRVKLEAILGLNVTAMSLMGEFGAVVAPLVGGAVSFLLKFN
jgi:hypothetical protein